MCRGPQFDRRSTRFSVRMMRQHLEKMKKPAEAAREPVDELTHHAHGSQDDEIIQWYVAWKVQATRRYDGDEDDHMVTRLLIRGRIWRRSLVQFRVDVEFNDSEDLAMLVAAFHEQAEHGDDSEVQGLVGGEQQQSELRGESSDAF